MMAMPDPEDPLPTSPYARAAASTAAARRKLAATPRREDYDELHAEREAFERHVRSLMAKKARKDAARAAVALAAHDGPSSGVAAESRDDARGAGRGAARRQRRRRRRRRRTSRRGRRGAAPRRRLRCDARLRTISPRGRRSGGVVLLGVESCKSNV